MKNRLRLTLLSLCLIVSSPSWADHFVQIDKAFKYWLRMSSLIETKQEGMTEFQNYHQLSAIALDRFLTETNTDWKIHRIVNYNWYGQEIGPVYTHLQVDPYGKTKRVLTGGYYYIYKGDLNTGARIVVRPSSRWVNYVSDRRGFSKSYLEIYHDGQGDPAVDEFRNEILPFATSKNPYRFGILELNNYANLQFLTNVKDLKYKWDDIILKKGLKDASYSSTEGLLKRFNAYNKNKVGMKKGVLLAGPPGTGKSFLGQILISSVLHGGLKNQATMIAITARHLIYKAAVKIMFDEAALIGPTTLFIEDIDLLGLKNRPQKTKVKIPVDSESEGGMESTATAFAANPDDVLNEFLNSMDGVVDSNGVLAIATTNKLDRVDHALLRSGRLGVHFYYGYPKFEERAEFFKRFATKKAVWQKGVTVHWLAARSEGLSGADIVELIGLAKQYALLANSTTKNGDLLILKEHFVRAINIVKNAGEDRQPLSLKEAIEKFADL